MAGSQVIAKRYARAFVGTFSSVAEAQKQLAALEALDRTVKENKKLAALVESPAFTAEEKWAVLGDILAKLSDSKGLANFLHVLIDAGRTNLLADLVVKVRELVLEKSGELDATVETAYALTESELSQIKEQLEKLLGKKVRIETQVKHELVAGLRIQVGGKTLDATLGSHFQKLQRQLSFAEA